MIVDHYYALRARAAVLTQRIELLTRYCAQRPLDTRAQRDLTQARTERKRVRREARAIERADAALERAARRRLARYGLALEDLPVLECSR